VTGIACGLQFSEATAMSSSLQGIRKRGYHRRMAVTGTLSIAAVLPDQTS